MHRPFLRSWLLISFFFFVLVLVLVHLALRSFYTVSLSFFSLVDSAVIFSDRVRNRHRDATMNTATLR